MGAVSATNSVSLTASEGAIIDDGDDTTRIVAPADCARQVLRSIGAPSMQLGDSLDGSGRLDTQASTLDATATGGRRLHRAELDGLTSTERESRRWPRLARIRVAHGAGDDLNLLSVSASEHAAALLRAAIFSRCHLSVR